MKFIQTGIEGAYLVEPVVIADDRGEFFRTFDEKLFAVTGLMKKFVQHNHSINYKKGTWRGFHYQLPPTAETKLVRCVRGRIFDIVLDLRRGSGTFMHWKGFELSAENKNQLLIPEGCAHGFITLEDQSELTYHHTMFYTPGSEGGIRHDDPRIKLKLPAAIENISERDQSFHFITDDFKGIAL
jgi:dTDP-4-dehydrorhamnose 3,5-epimerase